MIDIHPLLLTMSYPLVDFLKTDSMIINVFLTRRKNSPGYVIMSLLNVETLSMARFQLHRTHRITIYALPYRALLSSRAMGIIF